MSELRKKIAVILILALTFNTNAIWTLAESSDTFSNLEEISKEEKSTQYVEESLTIETSETSVTVALDNIDSGDSNIEENDEPSENESIVEEEPEEDESESVGASSASAEEGARETRPYESESESETSVGASSTSTDESESVDESESEAIVGASSTSAEEEVAEENIASPSDVEDEDGARETRPYDEDDGARETRPYDEDDGARETRPYDLIASVSETEFLEEVPIASLSEVVGFDDKLLGVADDEAYITRRLFFDYEHPGGYTMSGKPAANLKKIIIQIGGDIPEGFIDYGGLVGGVAYYDKGTDEYFDVLLYVDGVKCTSVHVGAAELFKDLINLEEIEGFEVVGTRATVNLEKLFENCKKLRSVRFDNFEASNIVTMERMFYGCEALTSVDLSNSNTTNVVNMSNMFYGCTSLESVNLSGDFDAPSVTTMEDMFRDCTSLKDIDLSDLNTSIVTNMSRMFYGCTSLESVNLTGNFDTSSVTTMEDMFRNCTSLKGIDLSNFKTASVTNFKGMFYGDSKLRIIEVTATDFVRSGIYGDHSGSSNMFYNCTNLVGGTGGNQSNVGSDDYYYKISTQDEGYARGLLTDKNDTSNHILPWSWFDEDLAAKNDYIQINIERGTDTSSYTKLYDLDTKGLSVYKKGNILIIHTLGASDTIYLGDCHPSIYHCGGGTFAYFNN